MPRETKPTVLIVEDHFLVSEMLAEHLQGAGFTVVGVAAGADEGIALYRRHEPDLVLCDVQLEGGRSGVDMTRELTGDHPDAVVLMLSAENDGRTVDAAYKAGARGYVSKRARSPELLNAIAEALAGMREVADRDTMRKIIEALRSPAPTASSVKLTPREREVIEHMAAGTTTTAALSARLHITANSVRSHVENCMRKLDVHSRAEIVAKAYQLGLIEPGR